jgi:hypothetical protein
LLLAPLQNEQVLLDNSKPIFTVVSVLSDVETTSRSVAVLSRSSQLLVTPELHVRLQTKTIYLYPRLNFYKDLTAKGPFIKHGSELSMWQIGRRIGYGA